MDKLLALGCKHTQEACTGSNIPEHGETPSYNSQVHDNCYIPKHEETSLSSFMQNTGAYGGMSFELQCMGDL